jgi:hypothetical protein
MNSERFFAGFFALLSVAALTIALVASEAMAQTTAPVVVEGEALLGTAQASDGQVLRQEMTGFGNGWSGNAQMFWGVRQPGAQLRLNPILPSAGLYEVRVFFTVAPDFGIAEISLGGQGLISFDGHNNSVALREANLGQLQLAAGPQALQLRVTGKSGMSTGYYMGIDRVEFRPAGADIAQAATRMLTARNAATTPSSSPPAPPTSPVPPPPQPPTSPPPVPTPLPENLEPWTTQDVIDSRIDVSAQYGLMRMLAGEPEERIVSSHILSAVKDKMLGGIYQEDQQVPALRAQASGYGWWQILPRSEAGGKVDSKCMTDPASKAPIIVMRKKAETNPVAYDKALQDAWYACGLPSSPVRPYAKTLPNKQPVGKTTRCATPNPTTLLVVGLERRASKGADGSAVAGAKVVVEGQGTAISTITNAWGFSYFDDLPGGLYLVTVQGFSGASGPSAINRTIDVLPNCTNLAWFEFTEKSSVDPCEKADQQWQDCNSPEIKKGVNDCNETFIKSDSACEDEPECEKWVKANYDECLQVLKDEIAACRAKLPKQLVCSSEG